LKIAVIQHKFVEHIPSKLDEGVIYISGEYATAIHLCADGCGNKVVTPISPTDWQLLFDGETVSLMPSIGNWNFPCRSHYWIKNDRIEWGDNWSDEQVEKAHQQQLHERNDYHDWRNRQSPKPPTKHKGLWQRFLRR
jgi:hypothetical protein